MKRFVFDSSSLISLALNDLLWLLQPLKKLSHGTFFLPDYVKHELVDVPFTTMKYKLEALVIAQFISRNILTRTDPVPVSDLDLLCNSLFFARGKSLRLFHAGELEALAVCLLQEADALIVDERTVRLLIEKPLLLRKLLERKMHTSITVDKEKLKQFLDTVKGVNILRSTELVTVAFEHGLLDSYITSGYTKRDLLEALLTGLRSRGCSIMNKEIHTLLRNVT